MTKFAVILSEEAITNLVNHSNVEDVNASARHHRQQHGKDLTKTEKELFFLITGYMVKHFGVAYMTKTTMAAKLDCSTKTIQRGLKKLSDLGIIEIFAARRKSGDRRQTANVIRLVRRPAEQRPAQCPSGNVPPKTHVLSLSKDLSSKTFEEKPTEQAPAVASVTKKELAEAYNIPQEVVYATNALRLSDRKFIELFANDGSVLRDALFKRATDDTLTPLLVRWELTTPVYLACLKSAAIRTAYVAKHRNVRNITAYFIATYCDLVAKEMQAIEAIAV